jgi:hypothetical protein
MATRHSFIATIVDPRYKLHIFEYLYLQEGGTSASIYRKGKAHFESTYAKYKTRAANIRLHKEEEARYDSDDDLIEEIALDRDSIDSNPYYGFNDFHPSLSSRNPNASTDGEVDRYLTSDSCPQAMTHEQIRNWWVKNQHNFPIIFQMWRDYAAIPATSAPSERVFSTAGNLITKKRTRMASETIRYVICLRAWGLLAKDDEEEEIQVIDLTDQIGSINDIVERVVHLHLPTLAERRIEEGLQKEEKEKTEALRLVAGSILKDDWEEANKRRLVRRATALIDAQKQLMEEVVREYTETL